MRNFRGPDADSDYINLGICQGKANSSGKDSNEGKLTKDNKDKKAGKGHTEIDI